MKAIDVDQVTGFPDAKGIRKALRGAAHVLQHGQGNPQAGCRITAAPGGTWAEVVAASGNGTALRARIPARRTKGAPGCDIPIDEAALKAIAPDLKPGGGFVTRGTETWWYLAGRDDPWYRTPQASAAEAASLRGAAREDGEGPMATVARQALERKIRRIGAAKRIGLRIAAGAVDVFDAARGLAATGTRLPATTCRVEGGLSANAPGETLLAVLQTADGQRVDIAVPKHGTAVAISTPDRNFEARVAARRRVRGNETTETERG